MKKKIPLTILETLQPIADKNIAIVKPIINESAMFHLIDIDENSDFYFKVVKQETRSDGLYYNIVYKPTQKDNVEATSSWTKIIGVASKAQEWVGIISSYNNLKTFYDDPLLESYEKNFIENFDIIDEDAEIAPFDLQRQIYLDGYLSETINKLENIKAGKKIDEVNELNNLQLEAAGIRKDLAKLTKKKTVRRLAKFWARTQRLGLDVIKEVFVNIATELTKRLLTNTNDFINLS